MSIDAQQILKLLGDLALQKPVFCSEMDFQLHLAWKMKEQGWELSLEYDPRCFEANAAIDIMIHKPHQVAIELKYKTALAEVKIHGQALTLKNQAAQDCGRYDFLKDIGRIEKVVSKGEAARGFAIFLTNDGGYWRAGKDGTVDAMFRMFEGRSVPGGDFQWGPHAGAGTMKGREKIISLTRDYVFGWRDYAKFETKNGVFRYLLVEVDPLMTLQPKAKSSVTLPAGGGTAVAGHVA